MESSSLALVFTTHTMALPATSAAADPVDPAVLADTILRSAIDGYYPDSEEVASADLTGAHLLPKLLKHLEAAKDDVKVNLHPHAPPP